MLGSSPVRFILAACTLAGLVHAGCRTVVPAPTPAPESSSSSSSDIAPTADVSASVAAPIDSATPQASASAPPLASSSAKAPESAPLPDPKVEEEKYAVLLQGAVSRVACASRKGVTLSVTLTVKNGLVETAKGLEPIPGSTSGQSRVLQFPALKGQAIPPLPSVLSSLFDKPYTFSVGC